MSSSQSMSFRADERKRRKLLYIATENQSFERTAIYSAFVVKGIFHSIQHKFAAYRQGGLPLVEMTIVGWLKIN